jgi:hypothetical protein
VNYSNWITVEFQPADHYVNLFPNPTAGSFQVSLQGYIDQRTSIVVTDVSGRIVSRTELLVQADYSTYTIDLQAEGSGLYFVTVASGDTSDTFRMVKY